MILNEEEKEKFKKIDKNNIKNINEFISKKIGIDKPSYYQKRQFINSFLSQIKVIEICKNKEDIIECLIKNTKYFTKNSYSNLLKDKQKKILTKNEILDALSSIKTIENDEDKDPLIFYNSKKKKIIKVYMSRDYYKDYTRREYLRDLKEIFNLYNPVTNEKEEKEEKKELELNVEEERKESESTEEEEERKDSESNEEEEGSKKTKLKSLDEIVGKEYVITIDNFRKMVKIYYRIISNINIIIMGETGCGKTLLIKKLYELLNNGKSIKDEYILNIHGGFTDEDIIRRIKTINTKVNGMKNLNKKIWVFIDEINSCKSMGLFNEIICNHSYNRIELNKNLVFIGACNPYRKSKNDQKICGLPPPGKKKNRILYNVNPLSHSLMNFVFYFGSLIKKDEEKYIKAIIEKIFNKDEEELKEKTTEMLCEAHNFIREKGDVSSISLREIKRFKKCYYFFRKYYNNKNKILEEEGNIKEKNYNDEGVLKIKSIILSLFTCYYLKIPDLALRAQFDTLINGIENKKPIMKLFKTEENGKRDEKEKLQNKDERISDIQSNDAKGHKNNSTSPLFSTLLIEEEEFILSQMELSNGIGQNRPLRDNIFLLFVAINQCIPIFIIGKPGCSKTLSVNLIEKSMSGRYSKKKFFKYYPALLKTWFQGSEITSPEEVENLFKTAENKAKFKNLDFYGGIHPISFIFFEEIGLCEMSDKNPLKILNFKLEYDNKKENTSFIGISNWALDASKMNRGFTLSVPELHEIKEDLEETCQKIVTSINPDLWKKNEEYINIFNALC